MTSEPSLVGAHAFRAQCLKAELERHLDEHGIVEAGPLGHALAALLHDIDHGICPRCAGPLRSFQDYEPVGSRVRACRCIPICAHCGELEGKEAAVGFRYGVYDWFSDREVRADVEHDVLDAAGRRSLLFDLASIEPELEDRGHAVG